MPQVTVPGIGPKQAKLMIVGEAPGENEQRLGKPFVGGAGQLLDTLLARVNINREDCYITNVVKVRPPANDLKRLHELGTSIEDYIPLLREEIHSVNPVVILALGAYAAYYLTNKLPLKAGIPQDIFSWRGSVLDCSIAPGHKVIPTLHPAYIMRDYSSHPLTLYDFERAKTNLRYREIRIPDLTIITRPSIASIEDYIKLCVSKRKFSFDIETIGGKVRCLGLSCEHDSAICIPFKHGILNSWSDSEESTIWNMIKTLFANPSVLKIAQNIQFDLHYLTPLVGFPQRPLADTMLLHHLLYPELPHDLDTLCSIYTDIGYYGIGQVEKSQDEVCWIYNGKDCIATLVAYDKMYEEASNVKLPPEVPSMLDFFHGFTMPLVRPLFEMQHRGVIIDEDAREIARATAITTIRTLQERLNSLAGYDINPKSTQQVANLLYTERNNKPIVDRKTQHVTTNKQALRTLSDKGSEEADLILEIRQVRDLKSKFLDVETTEKNTLHSEYVVSGTVTGRLSSREPLWGYGLNLQNIPRDKIIRAVFVPMIGNVFVKGDLSQAEARVFSWLSQGPTKDAFKRGIDIHSFTASQIYGGSWTDWGKGTPERDEVSKPTRHALNYGMKVDKLASLIKRSKQEAQTVYDRLHVADPSINEYHNYIQRTLQTNSRTLITPFGRRRQFLGRWSDDLFRQAYAYIPQSTVGDYLNIGLIKLYFRLMSEYGPNAFIRLQVHDEIVLETPRDKADEIAILLKDCMEFPLWINGEELIIPADIDIRDTWAG